MKSAITQIRKVQAEIDRQEACRRQIAKLERELQEAGEAVRTGTDKLILGLAQERGISSLAPAQILAIFDSVRVPINEVAASAPDGGPSASADAAALDFNVDGTGEVAVAVRFGNHEGSKKALLKEAGLTRNGKVGEWHGRVDRATLTRLREAFLGKVNVRAIHPQSTPAAAAEDPTANDPPAVDASDHSAGETSEAHQTVASADIEAAPSEPESANTGAAVGSPADGVAPVLESGRPASTPIPRGPFSPLPRRPETKRESGSHPEV
jgi:hypothetical protein